MSSSLSVVDDAERVKALEDLYAELPTIDCIGLCADNCTAIWMTRVEWDRVRKRMKGPLEPRGWVCPALRKGRCTVHIARPMVCRLWGATEFSPCKHGCKPSRVLTNEEEQDYMRRASELGA